MKGAFVIWVLTPRPRGDDISLLILASVIHDPTVMQGCYYMRTPCGSVDHTCVL